MRVRVIELLFVVLVKDEENRKGWEIEEIKFEKISIQDLDNVY